MAFENDITKLGWFDKTLDSCEVVSIPAGAAPKFIKVSLPSPEEPVIDAYWSGLPHLIVGSLVSIRRSPGNMAQYTVAGGGTGTATPADHNILSDEHADTLTASVVAGDIIIGNATPKWARLPKGTDGEVLTLVAGLPDWAAATGGGWPFAKVLSVSPTDPDAQYTTISAAITASSAGDVILVDSGTYTEQLTVNKAITIMGFDLSAVTVTNATNPTVSVTAAATLRNLTIRATGTGTDSIAVEVTVSAAIVNLVNCDIRKITGASTNGMAVRIADGTVESRYSTLIATAGSNSYGVRANAGTPNFTLYGGYVTGSTNSISGTVALTTLQFFGDPVITGAISWAGNPPVGQYLSSAGHVNTLADTRTTWGNGAIIPPWNMTPRSSAPSTPTTHDIYPDDGTNYTPGVVSLRRYDGSNWLGMGGDYGVQKVKNTSGATRAAGDVGYTTWTTGSGIEFKTTTTANDNRIGSVAVVLVGGANNADIYVTMSARLSIPYAGSAPAAGNFLVFSTTAAKVALQTTMSPDVVAVAMAAGAGGTVDALLVAGSVFKNNTPAFDIFRCDTASNSDFVATINGAPSGASVTYNAPSSGQEGNLTPASTSQIAKMVLHNTTRGTSALISTVNTGTNVITLTANAPGAWASGDTITIRSQTNTVNPSANVYFMDFEFVSDINDLARYFDTYLFHYDSGTAGQRLNIHPWQANANSKQLALDTYAAGLVSSVTGRVPLYQKRFCLSWQASGTGTGIVGLRLLGEGIAAP